MNDQSRIMGSLIDKLILLERWESPEAGRAGRADRRRNARRATSSHRSPTRIPDRRFAISTHAGILAAIDPTELGYVVTNLTDNAVKYGVGEIAVRVRARRLDGRDRSRRPRPGHSLDRCRARLRSLLPRRAARRRRIRPRSGDRQTRRRARARHDLARHELRAARASPCVFRSRRHR